MVSNFDTRLWRILRELGVDHLFDAVIISSEVQAEKPNPVIFQVGARWDGGPASVESCVLVVMGRCVGDGFRWAGSRAPCECASVRQMDLRHGRLPTRCPSFPIPHPCHLARLPAPRWACRPSSASTWATTAGAVREAGWLAGWLAADSPGGWLHGGITGRLRAREIQACWMNALLVSSSHWRAPLLLPSPLPSRNDLFGARDSGCYAWLWGSDVHSFEQVERRLETGNVWDSLDGV